MIGQQALVPVSSNAVRPMVHPAGALPPALAAAMEPVYRSAFTTLEYFRAFHGIEAPAAVSINGRALCYTVEGTTARLLNEICTIDAADLQLCAAALFEHHPEVTRIRLKNV